MQKKKHNLFTIGIITAASILLGCFAGNMMMFHDMVERMAAQYISEKNQQLAQEIFMNQIKPYILLDIAIVGGVVLLISALIFRYMKENKKREKALYIDGLTGLYNRKGFQRESRNIFETSDKQSYMIVYMNIVDFRYINESWGEEDGNRTLRFIAKMLSTELREGEVLGRSGMDHFFLLMNEKEEGEIAGRLNDVIDQMNRVINQKFQGFDLEFTIGACKFRKEKKISDLMNKAIYASEATEEKNKCTVYEGKIEEQFKREHWLNNVFEEALRNKEFQVYLQPKINLNSEKCCEAEALVRWKNPKVGFIYPSEFIPLFEQNGKIAELDLYMFEEVCRLLHHWHSIGNDMEISVNLSRFHLRNSGTDICNEYLEIKDKYEIPDGMIEIELTETMLLEDNQFAFVKKILDTFRENGVKVALDDFGFAYSSLTVLKDFDADDLKLDRAFFVNENEKSQKIVENMICLAHDLGMNVVAEGIERENQVESLRKFGCDMIQGYVYSKPLPVDEFEVWRNAYAK